MSRRQTISLRHGDDNGFSYTASHQSQYESFLSPVATLSDAMSTGGLQLYLVVPPPLAR